VRIVALTGEQQAAQLVFHLLNRPRQRRLADVAHLGSLGEVQRLAERQEITDFMQFHDDLSQSLCLRLGFSLERL
jgi:hypothetical protein